MTEKDSIIYFNGQFLPKADAAVSVDERGTLFADGVYEVLRYYSGRPLAMDLHVQRMRQSLERVRIELPADFDRISKIVQTLLQKNNQSHSRVYWQVSRGAAPRSPIFPKGVSPTVLVTADAVPELDPNAPVPTKSATLLPDERWSNCWIKSLMLLPNVLAANHALEAGFDIALLHRDNTITEATNANAMIVRDGELWTHPADRWILNGVTRQLVLKLAKEVGIPVKEQRYGIDQLHSADEVLLTGTTLHVAAVTKLDAQSIANGKVGPVTQRLHDAFIEYITKQCLT